MKCDECDDWPYDVMPPNKTIKMKVKIISIERGKPFGVPLADMDDADIPE